MPKIYEKIHEIFQKENIDADEVRKEVFEIYNIEENKDLDYEKATIEENENVAKWLNFNECYFLGYKSSTRESKSIFVNETEKLSYLWQINCHLCGDLYPIVNLTARIKPHTRQTKRKIRKEFKKNFSKSTSFSDLGFSKDDRLCIKVIFVLNNERDKDLDNMAKITLDSVKDLLGIDDMNIDHLDLMKVKTKYLESHIKFRIGKSELNTKNNIVLTGTNLKWAVDKLD